MDRIALTGQMYTGKSTVAMGLVRHGYMLANFTDILKYELATALQAVGMPVTLRDIRENKTKYRALLQEFGEVIGFSTDPRFVLDSLSEWSEAATLALEYGNPTPPVVFDNVRTPQQWSTLKTMGFSLVEVHCDIRVRKARALQAGLTVDEFIKLNAHPVERDFLLSHRLEIAYSIGSNKPIDDIVKELIAATDVPAMS